MDPSVETSAGLPYPLGTTVRDGGINVAVVSRHAEAVELCLFDAAGRERRIELPARSQSVWHGFFRGPEFVAGLVYGFRVQGPYAPEQGHRFNPNKLLLDPYAREIVGRFEWAEQHFGHTPDLSGPDPRDNATQTLKARVAAPLIRTRGAADRPVRIPAADTILYELHVKGFSKLFDRLPPELRGTYAGLAHPACIEHLQALGVTTLSLLPVHRRLAARNHQPAHAFS